VMKNNIYQTATMRNENRSVDSILEFCSIPRSRAELTAFTGKSRYYTMSHMIQPLVDQGKLLLTIPEKPKSTNQKYYRVP